MFNYLNILILVDRETIYKWAICFWENGWNYYCFMFRIFRVLCFLLCYYICFRFWNWAWFHSINIFFWNHEQKICIRSCDSCSHFICLKCAINLVCIIRYNFKAIIIKPIQTYIIYYFLKTFMVILNQPSFFAN